MPELSKKLGPSDKLSACHGAGSIASLDEYWCGCHNAHLKPGSASCQYE
ncbi:hypothetical protein [Tunturiibacter gelidoferens]|uniref:Uncharacterized protein n=1 Tax=Tunturiibacter gelidiferens TaxID=3069689 RepID=A0A9X0QFR8_9BACT|nr:hypothetical protein [Edaphobacter lichenicola]MBB5329429.1 hypothetical protein [Edaphobacter lichenicola]